MEELSPEWEDCNSFMYTHNWWHLALFHLENEDFNAALSLYDQHVWGRDRTFSQDQINAISMLWRLELAGAEVGDRWIDVAQKVKERSFVNDQPFLDMQYAFALAKGKHDHTLAALIEGMKECGEKGADLTRKVWSHVAVPAAQAFVAFAGQDYLKTISLLAPARAQMQQIGGSHAQRDLFEQVWIHSLLHAGKFDSVLPLIEQRLAFRKPVKLDRSLLSRATSQAARQI